MPIHSKRKPQSQLQILRTFYKRGDEEVSKMMIVVGEEQEKTNKVKEAVGAASKDTEGKADEDDDAARPQRKGNPWNLFVKQQTEGGERVGGVPLG